MKINNKNLSKTNHQAQGKSTNTSDVQSVELTPGQWEEMRRKGLNWERKHYGPRGQRAVREAKELAWLAEYMKPSKYPEVGVFFVWESKLLVSSIPWTLNPVTHGFRTYCVSHPTFWKSLQDEGKVPQNITYDLVPRGRVTFNEATGTFTLLADRCIFKDKDRVRAVINKFNLPLCAEVAADDQYLCAKCLNCSRSGGPKYAYDGEWEY